MNMESSTQQPNRMDPLPPIQLPSPIVHHFCIAPLLPPTSSYGAAYPPQPSTTTVSQKSAISKENIRKSSHSAIEKRRRERMNDKIDKLKNLIPSCTAQFPISVQQPIHKLSVLQAAIDYIEELHNQLERNLSKEDPRLKSLSAVFMRQKKKDSE